MSIDWPYYNSSLCLPPWLHVDKIELASLIPVMKIGSSDNKHYALVFIVFSVQFLILACSTVSGYLFEYTSFRFRSKADYRTNAMWVYHEPTRATRFIRLSTIFQMIFVHLCVRYSVSFTILIYIVMSVCPGRNCR